MKEQKEWRPLPDSITIKDSKIEGLGVFATKDIKSNTDLGISHVYDERFPDNYIRLPLGAFINHHEMPNCRAIVSESHVSIGDIKHIRIVAEKDISSGEELTLNYIINKLDNPLWEFEYEVTQ
ncbi:MAG: SET domain-containing protein-lysine N-methyltransferase [Cryomorphaceae bacterium]|jgi:SET domain-containing protein|nr:SET domain-containing protein-lysine N-methyltransferase [Cryomorphaceae bacterium]MBT7740035.1 SET domain-containing protein-lysine N-methyltransferase [Cryomorphaceae bacterium]